MARRVISLANQKGGVGKTTTAINLASALAHAGKSTLLLDADPQANATVAVLGNQDFEFTLYDLLSPKRKDRKATLARAVQQTPTTNLDVLPSEPDLAGAEKELAAEWDGLLLLRKCLKAQLPKTYDYVIIDTPPSLGQLTINALATSTEVVIPVSVSVFAIKGVAQLEQTIALVREKLEWPQLTIGGVLCTMSDYTLAARDVHILLQQRYGKRLFTTVIPKTVRVEEAISRHKTIFEYAPDSKAALAYAQFSQEVIRRGT